MKLGAQLYTLREHMKTPEQIERSLKRVADIGYKTIQVSAIGRIDCNILAQICRDLGLEIVITHTNPDRIIGDTTRVIAEHDIMKSKYIGLGALAKGYRNEQGIYDFAQNFERAINEITLSGKFFTYHNHAFEFEKYGSKLLFDKMLELLTPDQMKITLDCYWVNYGGADVCDWVDKLAGRIDCVHLKDYGILNDKIVMLPVMEGNMNYPKILEHLEHAGTKYAFVEQDDCNGADPFECLEISYNNLIKYFEV